MVIGPYGRHGGLGESFGNLMDGRKRKFDSAACGPSGSGPYMYIDRNSVGRNGVPIGLLPDGERRSEHRA